MSLRHALSTAVNATGHNGYLIRSFVAASRAELSPGIATSRLLRPQPWTASRTSARAYSIQPDSEQPALDTAPAPSSSGDALSVLENDETPSATTNIPWYLQQNTSPSPSPSTISARRTLPALPPHPPPLLSPLLSHLSIDLGLDDISLLDLRTLDPPAALGSNLLMLLCTARSEKHLHVSADRLCRWLRSAHALRPFADGLLGRNELKLMAKRKAKRVRLLSSVGAKARDRGDEGARPGWVCVNLGLVEWGVLPRDGEVVEQEYVGFRTEEKGCRVVVQMMTDEKRGVLDLESLWTGYANRSRREEGDREEAKKVVDDSPFPEARTVTN